MGIPVGFVFGQSVVCAWSMFYVGRVEWSTGSAATPLWYVP